MIKQEIVDKIINSDLLSVVMEYATLTKSGVSYKGVSPFKDSEKTPSFYVHPIKNIFKCFSTGTGGWGPVDFVMKKERASFPEALEIVARVNKIQVEYEEDLRTEGEKQKEKDRNKEAEAVINLAHETYAKHAAEQAEWFKDRGLTDDDISKWSLGYAPNSWEVFTKQVIKQNLFTTAETIGLIKVNEESGKSYDNLRGRITFPIYNSSGRCVGFAGRDITGAEKVAKYINPIDSFMYHKERILYGMHIAQSAIRDKNEAWITEGYMDVIAMHRMGFDNTVASSGTSITDQQLKMLSRMCDRIVFVVEDEKAIVGVRKGIRRVMQLGLEAQVCYLVGPNGEKNDPDEIAKSHTRIDVFEKYLRVRTIDGVKWMWDQLCKSMDGAKGKQLVVDEMCETLADVPEDFSLLIEAWSELAQDAICDRIFLEMEMAELHNIDVEIKSAEKIEDENKRDKKITALESKRSTAIRRQETKRKNCQPGAKHFAKSSKYIRAEREKDRVAKLKAKQSIWESASDEDRYALTEKEIIDTLGEDNNLPQWVKEKIRDFRIQSLLQLESKQDGYQIGIYFPNVISLTPDFKSCLRCTNFIIQPLYHIRDQIESQRMVKFTNDRGEQQIAELNDQCLAGIDSFKKLLNRIGYFCLEPHFGSYHFTKLVNYIKARTSECYELKHLGWNNKGFLAFSNLTIKPVIGGNKIYPYNELGICDIDGHRFLSPSQSPSRRDDDGNMSSYEDELYFTYVESKIKFNEWAELFVEVYGEKGRTGLAFVLMTAFRDLIFQNSMKCPHLYLHGEAQSGKSQMAESIYHLFFCGKNSSGLLRPGLPMSSGMITPYAMADAMQMFQNCPTLYNEWDMDKTDPQYYGWMKNAFDGEGRKRGSVSSGRAKSETMHIRGTSILVGQYPDTRDDGALLTRCLQESFTTKDIENKTDRQRELHIKLKELEEQGLSSIICEIISWRSTIAEGIREKWSAYKKMLTEMSKDNKQHIEQRLLENYSLALTMMEFASAKAKLPFHMSDFLNQCYQNLVKYSATKVKFSVLNSFWGVVEDIVLDGRLQHGKHYEVKAVNQINLRKGDGMPNEKWVNLGKNSIAFIHLSSVIGLYQKEMKSRGTSPWDRTTIIDYMKNQDYFIGMCPTHNFTDGQETSAWAFNYDMMRKAELNVFRMSGNVTQEMAFDGEEAPY